MGAINASTSQEQIKILLEWVELAIETKDEIGAAELDDKNTIEHLNSFLTSFAYVEEAYTKYKKLREEELTAIEAQTGIQKSESVWDNIFVAKGYQFRD